MDPAEKIYLIRARLALSQTQLAKKIGVSQSAITNLEAGLTQRITDRIANKFKEHLNVNPEWLRASIGDPFLETIENKIELISEQTNVQQSSHLHTKHSRSNLSPSDIVTLPLLVGNLNFTVGIENLFVGAGSIEVSSSLAGDADFVYRYEKLDMILQGVTPGSSLLCKKFNQLDFKNNGLYLINLDGVTMCRVVSYGNDNYVLQSSMSENGNFKKIDLEVEKNKVEFLGIVSSIYTKV